jgi:hypothetical protein
MRVAAAEAPLALPANRDTWPGNSVKLRPGMSGFECSKKALIAIRMDATLAQCSRGVRVYQVSLISPLLKRLATTSSDVGHRLSCRGQRTHSALAGEQSWRDTLAIFQNGSERLP